MKHLLNITNWLLKSQEVFSTLMDLSIWLEYCLLPQHGLVILFLNTRPNYDGKIIISKKNIDWKKDNNKTEYVLNMYYKYVKRQRERGQLAVYYTSPQSFKLCFLIRWLNNFGDVGEF